MPPNPFNGHTDYGIGIGLRVSHYRDILKKRSWIFSRLSLKTSLPLNTRPESFMVDGPSA